MLKIKTKNPLYTSHRCHSPENLQNWHTKAMHYKILSNMLSVVEVIVSSSFSTYSTSLCSEQQCVQETTFLYLHHIKEFFLLALTDGREFRAGKF